MLLNGIEIKDLKNLSINIYSSILHNNQNVETTQMFINESMNKQNVVYNEQWDIIQPSK